MLEIIDLHKQYEGKPLLKGVSFKVEQGETVCLLGSSGSGKSTILQIISGLQEPENGHVLWRGRDIGAVPVHKRNFGLMFQDYALFPHRNVQENIAFGLRMQGISQKEIGDRVREVLTEVNLAGFENRRVTDLSGGEQQRVALARALVPRPELLMLDEPMGALDRTMKDQLIEQLRRILHVTGIPVIYVTHDQEEAFWIGDRLILLHNGVIEQQGPPFQVYNHPANQWVAQFLGLTNFLQGKLISIHPIRIETPQGILESRNPLCGNSSIGDQITVLLRPFGPVVSPDIGKNNVITGIVRDVLFRSHGFQVEVQLMGDTSHHFILDGELKPGDAVGLYIPPEAVICLEN